MKPGLELILFGLTTILRRNAEKTAVRTMLRERNASVEIRTSDGSVARHFVFCGGRIFSQRGRIDKPDASLIWRDSSIAFSVLKSGGPDAIQSALANGHLSIAGNAETAAWFGKLLRTARGHASTENEKKPPVAVVGLGRMGAGIARSLVRNGFPVVVYNRTEEKTRPLVDVGAKAASSPAAAARGARYVITSLMDDSAVLSVVEGPDGLVTELDRGAVHIGTSTISAETARHLARLHTEHGSEYLAAPVVGRPDAADAGELVALVCGKPSIFEDSRKMLQGFTRQILFIAEDHALANTTKLAVNYSAATAIDLMGQVYTFGEKAGVPLSILHGFFTMMWGQPILQEYASRILHRRFDDVGFDLQGGLKDVTLMANAAKELGVAWDFADTIQGKMARGIETGLGRKDWSSIYEVTRAEAGLCA